jgi:hypothetical protein
MARREQALTADVYGNQYSTAQLQEIRRKLAKRANNSLRDLARNSSPITGEVYNSYGAAVDALDYLKARNRRYFSESLTLTENRTVLKAEIQRLQYFLTRPSHTVKGQREIEQKRIETFEKKGIHFANSKEFYQFFSSETFQSLCKLQYSSEQLIEDYERAREQGMTNDQVMEKLSNALDTFRKGEKVTQKNLWKHLDISPFDNSANG